MSGKLGNGLGVDAMVDLGWGAAVCSTECTTDTGVLVGSTGVLVGATVDLGWGAAGPRTTDTGVFVGGTGVLVTVGGTGVLVGVLVAGTVDVSSPQ